MKQRRSIATIVAPTGVDATIDISIPTNEHITEKITDKIMEIQLEQI